MKRSKEPEVQKNRGEAKMKVNNLINQGKSFVTIWGGVSGNTPPECYSQGCFEGIFSSHFLKFTLIYFLKLPERYCKVRW